MAAEDFLAREDATGLAARIRAGDVTATDVLEAAIARAEAVNPRINAIAEKLYDQARASLAHVNPAAPFAFVPFALKDLGNAVEGVPVHSGSRLPPRVEKADSTLTARFRAAGLLPIATTTSPEFGVALVTETAAFGPTLNPWNTGHTPGGSSGGAAALVAAGAVPMAHASDGGGSIRVPAACTGLVGLKPSRGRVPLGPFSTEDWHGFIIHHVVCRSVRDCAAMLDAVHGPDATAPYLAPPPRGAFARAADAEARPMAIGVWRGTPLGLEVSVETQAALETAVALAVKGGHRIEEIDLPEADRGFMIRFAQVVASFLAAQLRDEEARLGRDPRPMVERGTRVLARLGELHSAGFVHHALRALHTAARSIITRTAHLDAVLMPLIAHPPLPIGATAARGADALVEAAIDSLRLTRLLRVPSVLDQLIDKSLRFTHWPAIQNVTGQPAIAMPVHVTDAGLPLGIQAVGRPGDEETLLTFAAQMERLSGWRDRWPLTGPV